MITPTTSSPICFPKTGSPKVNLFSLSIQDGFTEGIQISQHYHRLVKKRTNDNVLIQVSGGGPNTVSGQGKEMAKLKFAVINSSGNSPLSHDQTANHTYLTTIELKDIAGDYINFVDGSLEIVPTNVRPGEKIATPSNFILHRNYPNPFNPETRIKYELPHSVRVRIKVIFNITPNN